MESGLWGSAFGQSLACGDCKAGSYTKGKKKRDVQPPPLPVSAGVPSYPESEGEHYDG